jgi:hypothetical protein
MVAPKKKRAAETNNLHTPESAIAAELTISTHQKVQ